MAIIAAGSALVVAVGTLGVALAAPAGAAATGTGPTLTCAAAPPGGNVAFSGSLTNTVATLGGAAKLSGLSGHLCGTIDLATLTASIQPSQFRFTKADTTLFGLLPLPTTTTVTAPASATLAANPHGGYDTSMRVSLQASASILGLFTCNVGPFTPTFTTGRSGSLTGTPLTGSLLSQLSGTLVADDFSVPAITPSASCPGFIAGIADLVMGLPLAAGRSTITSTATLAPVLPSTSSSTSSGSGGTGGSTGGGSGHSGGDGSGTNGSGGTRWGWGWGF